MTRKEQILAKASELFQSKGYSGTSMRDIASALDMRSSSLYTHIDSKEELLWELVNEAAQAFLQALAQLPVVEGADERLEHLIHAHLKVVRDNLANATILFHEWRFLPPELHQAVVDMRDEYESYFRQAIADGLAQGIFQTSNVKLASLYILSALNWTYHWLKDNDDSTFEDFVQNYVELCLNALGYTPTDNK